MSIDSRYRGVMSRTRTESKSLDFARDDKLGVGMMGGSGLYWWVWIIDRWRRGRDRIA